VSPEADAHEPNNARAPATLIRIDNVRFQQCSADDPALTLASFDVVMVMNLLRLLRHLSAGLRRIHDLVPGGLFISKTPCIGDRGVGVRIVIPQLRAVALPLTRASSASTQLTTLIASSGFEIRETAMYPGKTRSFSVVAHRAADS